MPLTGRYRAVIFDMDGLLLDTETLWHEAETELFRRHGAEFTHEDQLQVIGTNFDITARYFAQRLGWPLERRAELVKESTALMHERVKVQVNARPGAVELIEGLRDLEGIGLGLASNSPRYLVEDALRTAGLPGAFDSIVTSDDVKHGKPAPDIYLLACERLGVDPSQAVALEDSASGVAAAKAAGLTCIAVPMFAETDVSAADRVVDSLEELLTG
ncbi:MAG: HAD family phosphatase [Chloroflexota bacterium]|nr:HAD family phosphatase [Chloroflexota bacterium]